MGLEILLPLLFGALSFAVGTGVNIWQNKENKKAVENTNSSNLQAVRETNQSNVEQADLAYQRSLPINQVRNLMDAGLSRAGALQSLSGGGTYQAPVLQSSSANAPQMDFSGVMSAIERLNNIPSNVEQHQLVLEQREALRTDTRIKEERAIRERELHDAQMFEHIHGRKVTEAVDNLASKVINYAADNNIDLDSIDSPQKMVSLCKLQNDPDWRDMPAAGRLQLFNAVRLTAQENRSNQQQNNQNIAAQDAHIAAIDALKNSQFGRSLTSKQIDKIDRELQVLQQQIDSYNDSSDARTAENNAREIRAKFESLASSFGLSMAELRKDFYFDQDGKPKLHTLRSASAKEFWDMVSKVIGLDTIGDSVIGKLFK